MSFDLRFSIHIAFKGSFELKSEVVLWVSYRFTLFRSFWVENEIVLRYNNHIIFIRSI